MRRLLTALLFGGLTSLGVACSAQTPPKDAPKPAEAPKEAAKESPKAAPLKVGDAAPAITVQKWLNGTEVKGFEAGKVYVLDFWATWCGPCIQAMPHLAELSKEYAKAGLVVFPVTTTDKRNTLKQVEEFVAKRGPKLGVPFAVCETDVMDKAWFEASGQQGIPCSFVVDKAGKIAFIGHPMELDEVLPMVLDGTWKGEASVKAIAAVNDELEAIQGQSEKDGPAALLALDAFGKKYPKRLNTPGFVTTKLVTLVQAKKFDEAKAFSEQLLADAAKSKKDTHLRLVGGVWGAKSLNPDKLHLELVTRAADAALALDDKDALTVFRAASAYNAAGNAAKAADLGAKAVALADDEDLKAALKAEVAKFGQKDDAPPAPPKGK